MDMTHNYWDDAPNMQHAKYETNLNFATAACSEDDSEFGPYKKNKVSRQDPMSHRIIEKRRRDRMNNCLADLSRLIPAEYLKKGRGRVEKTEIIEMAIKHMKRLQQEVQCPSDHYRLGYQECMSETMKFMVEIEGHFPREALCMRLLNHLQQHCEALCRIAPVHTNPQTPLPPVHETVENGDHHQVAEYVTPKIEPNNNSIPNDRIQEVSEAEHYEKHSETYKYKNDIKLRFTQDLNAVQNGGGKQQKLDGVRRNSSLSVENHSSSHSSSPTSELCTRVSSETETTHRVSPAGSSVSQITPLKSEPTSAICRNPYDLSSKNSTPSNNSSVEVRTNFSVPIFVLHAKGSFYIPLTIDYNSLVPFLHNYDLLEVMPNMQNIVLHPVTINVNFQPTLRPSKGDYGTKWR